MDICVVTYRNTADRVALAIRRTDQLWVRDNTRDNIGFAAAANELAAKGSDAAICFVNPDGDPQPGCFDLLEQALAGDGIVAAEPSQGPASAGVWTPDRELWLSGACLAVRRSAFESLGGFDTRLFMYGEDVDLSIRLSRLGRLAHCWEAEFLHDAGRRSYKAERLQARNSLVLNARYGFGAGPRATVRGIGSAVRCADTRLAAARAYGLMAFLVRRSKFVP